jgi:hypothetical protein
MKFLSQSDSRPASPAAAAQVPRAPIRAPRSTFDDDPLSTTEEAELLNPLKPRAHGTDPEIADLTRRFGALTQLYAVYLAPPWRDIHEATLREWRGRSTATTTPSTTSTSSSSIQGFSPSLPSESAFATAGTKGTSDPDLEERKLLEQFDKLYSEV